MIQQLDILIIDEISMVRADVLDAINKSLQINRRTKKPFGGVQVVAVGDLFQLPPVVKSYQEKQYFKSHYESEFFFSAKVFEEVDNSLDKNLSKIILFQNVGFISKSILKLSLFAAGSLK